MLCRIGELPKEPDGSRRRPTEEYLSNNHYGEDRDAEVGKPDRAESRFRSRSCGANLVAFVNLGTESCCRC